MFKSLEIKISLEGRGIVGFNGTLNTKHAVKFGVLDPQVALHKNFKLPNFIVRDGQAHLVDSKRNVLSKFDDECRQQVTSYLGSIKDPEVLRAQMSARPTYLMFGYLSAVADVARSYKRAATVLATSLVDKTPTTFMTDTVTQRGEKVSKDTADDKSGTSLSYTVTCDRVCMEGEINVNFSELSFVPMGAERDRPAVNPEMLGVFQEAMRKILPSIPDLKLSRYVRKKGDRDIAETGVILDQSYVIYMVEHLIVDLLPKLEKNYPAGRRNAPMLEFVLKTSDGELITTSSAEEVIKLLKDEGIFVNYEEGESIYVPTSEEERAAKAKAKADVAKAKKKGAKKKGDEADDETTETESE